MKFFTLAACETFDEIEPFREADAAYRRHLEGLRGVLDERILQLAEPAGLENALVVRVDHDQVEGRLRLTLRCGHLQMGYSDLILTYLGAEIEPDHVRSLATIARSTKSLHQFDYDFAYHELDVTEPGRIEHRLIFRAAKPRLPNESGWTWFAIQCSQLDWQRKPRRSRRLPPLSDRYPGAPSVLGQAETPISENP